ncbi:MAG: sugar phosphate isomerase/epimerase [Acidimicrobiales bacterium]|jgi:sugar phosphate isomerase/epimerase
MDIGLLTDSVEDLTFDQTLDLANEVGLSCVEFAAGNWSTSPHIDVPALLENRRGRAEFLRSVESRGLRISALNASGNQLHPRDGKRNDKMVRDIIRLAGEFGVTTIVLMSGLPGGTPNDQMPNWITTSWPPETTEMLDYQWNDVAIPYWHDLAAFASANGITRMAIEMHGNQIVFSVPGVLRLRSEIGDIVGANLDPSHLIWMGADPLRAVTALGSAIYYVHAKDTRVEDASAVRSRLEPLTLPFVDERAWNFVTVGRGHDFEWWTTFVDTLASVGYDGTLSIEHEDASVSGVDGVREAAALLHRVLAQRSAVKSSSVSA